MIGALVFFCNSFSKHAELKNNLVTCGYKESDISLLSLTDWEKTKEISGTPPTLIFCQLLATDRENFELLNTFRSVFPFTPVIGLSDHTTEQQGLNALEYGLSDYLNLDNYSLPLLKKTICLVQKRTEEKHKHIFAKGEIRRLFYDNPQPMWLYDVDSTRFIRVNKAAIKKYGYTQEEFRQLSIRDIRPEADIERLNETIGKKSTDGFSPKGIWRHRTKSGKILFVEIISYKTSYKGSDAVMVLALDKTEEYLNQKKQKIQKRELSRIEANQEALINTTRNPMWSIDRNLKIITFNKAFEDFIYDSVSEEIRPGDHVIPESFDDDLKSRWLGYYIKALNGNTFEVIEDFESPNGDVAGTGITTFIPIISTEDGITVEGVACYSKDITEIKKAQEKLALSEKHFRSLVQEGSDLIAILDECGNYVYVSPTSGKILGISPDNLIGRNAFDYIHAEDKKFLLCELKKLAHRKSVPIKPFRFKDNLGSWRWIESIVTNLRDDPAVRGIVVNSRDVTERIKAEEEREQLIHDLIKYNEELLQFSYITSHNLRAPLSNLLAISKMIDRSTIQNPTTLRLIEGFATSTERLNETVNHLLEVLVIKKNRNVDVESLDLQFYWDLCKTSIDGKIQEANPAICVDFSKAPTVFFNKSYLDSLFLNLISNSLKYRSPVRDLVINVKSYSERDRVVIEFSDNGLGIDLARYGTKVFGLHQRFHDHVPGKGLGLFLVKAHVTSFGGSIEVESEVNRGTVFFIKLPNC